MVKILPSVLSADFSILKEEIEAIELAGADMHHVDVMDGHFVPNISFGPVVIKGLAKVAKKPLDIHLMISEPEKYLDEYIALKPELITIHAEILGDVSSSLAKIKAAGIKVGLSIKPATTLSEIKQYCQAIDVLLVMSVEPGFGGQKFIPESVAKIAEAKAYFTAEQLDVVIEVDGGINSETAKLCQNAGAEWLVAGSTVYTADKKFKENIARLR